MGWIGRCDQITYTLGIVGADKDEDGRFLLYNAPVTSFLGMGEECVVPDETSYLVGGNKCSLAGLLNSTSYGLNVTVIS
jgi:hypothetical protein